MRPPLLALAAQEAERPLLEDLRGLRLGLQFPGWRPGVQVPLVAEHQQAPPL